MEKPTTHDDSENPHQPTTTLSGVSTTVLTSSEKTRPSLIWPFAWLVLTLGWMAPIVALLVMNFKGYIAGASVACGVRDCNDNPWDGSWGRVSEELDLEDHNINGALQLVAKALEIWFIFLAGGLIFDLTMWLARTRDGLPIRYLVIPTEFGELISFFSLTVWTSPRRLANTASNQQTGHHKSMLYIFIIFTAIVCVICNLMGPATAVLLLPTLVWRAISIPENQAIATIGASSPPALSSIIQGCTASDLADGSYSCTGGTMSNILEMLLIEEEDPPNWTLLNKQGFLAFSFNLSGNYLSAPGLPLIPNRQTVDYMSYDFNEWSFSGEAPNYTTAAQESLPESLTPSLYQALRNSQHVIRRRQGPGYLFSSDCTPGLHQTSTIQLSGDKMVRCFDFIESVTAPHVGLTNMYAFPNSSTDGEVPISTMCIRTGSGWAGSNAYSRFYLTNSSSSTPVSVNVYSSDKAIYLNSSTYPCSTNRITTEIGACDWDSLFAADPDSLLKNVSTNPLVTEYVFSDNSTSSWCVSFIFLRYPTYVFDTSPISNPLFLVTLTDNGPLTPFDLPIFVHPDWMLAGWTVDKNRTVSDTGSGEGLFVGLLNGGLIRFDELSAAQQVVTAQALSLIGYTLEDASTRGSSISPQAPVLDVSILVYVWSYGLPTRTSQLGVVVAIVGCVIVLMRAILGLATRTVPRETLGFVTTALEQEPPGIFKDLNEDQVGRVRFRMKNRDDAGFEFLD